MTESLIQERPLTINEAAEFLNFKKSYLHKLIHLRKIPCYHPSGKRVYFKLSELKDYAFRNRQSADFELAEKAEALING
jgi:excisionase family DNA binding protein